MKVTDPVAQEVVSYADEHDMSQKDALARMLAEAGYDV
jgi:uncharacterized protein YbjQ (UPF0145 family)